MKRSHSLNTVLRLRRLAEEQEERLLEKILLERARIEEAARKEQQLIIEAYRARHAGGAVMLANDLHESYGQVVSLTERVRRFEEQKEKLAELADQQRTVLQKARQQRETVESLLDRHWQQVDLVESRREQRTMDDIHGSQRIRKQIEAANRASK